MPHPAPLPAGPRWDLFCRVIDNHGDLGVCWRLAQQLARRGCAVRLVVDEPAALAWMAPADAQPVQVLHWTGPSPVTDPADVVVEAFGCDPPEAYRAAMKARAQAPGGHPPVWINLEYLSAEAYVARSHGLRSPQFSGPAAGLDKWFFYPGFTTDTGGLLHDDAPAPDSAAEAATQADTRAWLQARGLAPRPGERVVLVFGYDNPRLPGLLAGLAGGAGSAGSTGMEGTRGASGEAPDTAANTAAGAAPGAAPGAPGSPAAASRGTLLWLCPGPLQQALGAPQAAGLPPGIRALALPPVPQPRFDALLSLADLNLVRGEDSFVRAQVAAEAPMLWQIYPQQDGAHAAKLEAFADRLLDGAPPALAAGWRAALRAVSGTEAWAGAAPCPPLTWAQVDAWRPWQAAWRRKLRARVDLADALIAFAAAHASPGHAARHP